MLWLLSPSELPHSITTVFCRPRRGLLFSLLIGNPALKGRAIFIRPLTRTKTPFLDIWSAPAEQSGDGALDES
jgi:hypothetical protein